MSLLARPVQLNTSQAGFEAAFKLRLHWSSDTDDEIEQRVADILRDVQLRGDAAVLAYTQLFDGLAADEMQSLELTQAELKAAFDGLPPVQQKALQDAAARVRSYHEAQKKPRVRAGPTAMPTARCWAKKSHHSTVWAFTCRVAKRRIPPAC